MEYHLKTPVSEEEIRSLRVNDIVYVDGLIFTARDMAHKRAIDQQGKQTLPFKTAGLALYHCGPIVKRTEEGWQVVSAGPTTSTRMETLESDFIKKTGVRIVIGKGGMGEETTRTMMEYGAVYATFTGGAAVLAAQKVVEVKAVEWLDLGMPEALWLFEVKDFGPLIVAIDCKGGNIYREVIKNAKQRSDALLKRLNMKR